MQPRVYKKKGIKKKVHATVYTMVKNVYILPYTIPHELCTHYPAHHEADCVHTTVYKKKGQKREVKKQARVYKKMESGFACGSRRNRDRLGCTKIKKSCTPLVVELTAEHTLGYT